MKKIIFVIVMMLCNTVHAGSETFQITGTCKSRGVVEYGIIYECTLNNGAVYFMSKE